MADITSPLQFAGVASALLWPLAAGVAMVVASRMRAAAETRGKARCGEADPPAPRRRAARR